MTTLTSALSLPLPTAISQVMPAALLLDAAAPIVAWLGTYLLVSTLLFGVLLGALRLHAVSDRVPAAAQERLLRSAVVLAIAQPLVTPMLGYGPQLSLPATAAVEPSEGTPSAPTFQAGVLPLTEIFQTDNASLAAPPSNALTSERSARATSWLTTVRATDLRGALSVALLIWLGVALLLAIQLLVQHTRFRRRLRTAMPLDDVETLGWLRSLARKGGVDAPRLLVTSALRLPVVFGWKKATICAPPTLLELPKEQQHSALAHEVAHVVRRDAQRRLVDRLLGAILFFQPLQALVNRRLAELAEMQADDWVVTQLQRPIALAQCLTRFAESAGGTPAPVPALAARSGVGRRIERLVERREAQPTPKWLLPTCTLALVAIGLVAPSVGLEEPGEPSPPSAPAPAVPPQPDEVTAPAIAAAPSAPATPSLPAAPTAAASPSIVEAPAPAIAPSPSPKVAPTPASAVVPALAPTPSAITGPSVPSAPPALATPGRAPALTAPALAPAPSAAPRPSTPVTPDARPRSAVAPSVAPSAAVATPPASPPGPSAVLLAPPRPAASTIVAALAPPAAQPSRFGQEPEEDDATPAEAQRRLEEAAQRRAQRAEELTQRQQARAQERAEQTQRRAHELRVRAEERARTHKELAARLSTRQKEHAERMAQLASELSAQQGDLNERLRALDDELNASIRELIEGRASEIARLAAEMGRSGSDEDIAKRAAELRQAIEERITQRRTERSDLGHEIDALVERHRESIRETIEDFRLEHKHRLEGLRRQLEQDREDAEDPG